MAKVNIIMSVYNQEMYVEESINSVLDQTYADFNLIVINDGSTDASANIITSFTDKRIQYISNAENKGLIYSLNLGIEISLKSDCTYIARMDSDDIAVASRLQQQVAFLDANPQVGLLGGAMEFFGIGIKPQKKYAPATEKRIVATFFSYNSFFHPTVMFRKEVVLNNRYSYNFPKYEDYGLWIDLIGTCGFYNLPSVLIKYRRHNTSVTSTYKSDYLTDQEIFKRLLIHLGQKLNISFTDKEIEILSIITTANRATIKPDLALADLKQIITGVVEKTDAAILDQPYLKQLLVERAILYLKTNNRKADIFRLIKLLKAGKQTIAIAMATFSGRKW